MFFVGDDACVSTAALQASCWGQNRFSAILLYLSWCLLDWTYREELLEGALLRARVRHVLVGLS
jgi:hypothetical protein